MASVGRLLLVGALALAIDAYLGRPTTPEPPVAPPDVPKASAALATPAPVETPPPPPEPFQTPQVHSVPPLTPVPRSVSGYVGVDALGNVGVAPKLSVGPGFFAGVRLRDPEISFELGGRVAWTVAATDEATVDGTLPIRSTFLALTAGACGTLNRFVFLCGHAGAGTLVLSTPKHSSFNGARSGFAIVGGRLGVERAIAPSLELRAFVELDGLPRSADLNVVSSRVWAKPVLMGAVGVGVVWGRW